MNPFDSLGKILIFAGILLVVVGALFMLGRHLPFLGNLPGDFTFQRKGVHFFFPLATCLLISLVLTVLLNLIFRR
jgi:hypothetical protein